LKVGDIFESKIKLLQVLSEWSIMRSVSFKPVKLIRHATQEPVVLMILVVERSVRGKFMSQSQKLQVDISRLKNWCESIHLYGKYRG